MAVIHRVSIKDSIPISPTRTYILVVYDEVTPNEVRFVKFVLPFSYPNNVVQAKFYGKILLNDEKSNIIDCLPYEDYMEVKQVFEDFIEVKPDPPVPEGVKFSFYPMAGGLAQDMQEVRQLLDAWNDEQPNPSNTYSGILRTILMRVTAQKIVLDDTLKELTQLVKDVQTMQPKDQHE